MTSDDPPLQIQVLGGLHLTRNGREVKLPASKKTRALLGYLIVTGHPHRRERLCDLLWDGPDDPRAELRWSVSKLRPLLTVETGSMLLSDREQVGFTPEHAEIDLLTVRSLLDGGIASAPIARLQAAAALHPGELLDGLDLPLCYRYQEWCTAAREAAGRQHRAILAELVRRLDDRPEDALPYARALVAADPLAESGHATIIRLLGRLGRPREAQAHYGRARQVLASELGVAPGAEMAAAYASLRPVAIQSAESPAPVVLRPPPPDRSWAPAATFVGRHDERALIDQIVATASTRRAAPVLLVTGEPGIGKSHLLAHLATRLTDAGGIAFGARAYEAEVARPYGVWIDLLRTIIRARRDAALPGDLGLLLPELGPMADTTADQTRLFDAVVAVLRPRAEEPPLSLMFDDIQWLDKASCALLHYVARQIDATSGLLLAAAGRTGETEDNAAAAGVLRSLRRDGRLREIALTTLGEAETRTLARTVDASVDAARIYRESGGNPLFTLELARVQRHGEREDGRTIGRIVAEQVGRLHDRGRDLLVWAAALDRSFRLDDLARVLAIAPPELLAALAELERHGLIRPTGADAYEFRHDLIRHAVYHGVSQPRRTVIHRQIARALLAAADRLPHPGRPLGTVPGTAPALASDAAHHAALGNDHDVAARACVLAGQHALRLFAMTEALGFADRGLLHLAQLPRGPATVERRMGLLEIRLLAAVGPGMHLLPPIEHEILEAVTAAETFGLHAVAATGHYLLSVLYQDAGNLSQAAQSTLRAAQAGRTTTHPTRAHQLANSARCLLELETQVGRARGLIAEAETIAAAGNLELCELHWAMGLLQRWNGGLDAAVRSIERALALARHTEDRRREYKCLTALAILAFEQGVTEMVAARCAELSVVAARMGNEGTPVAATLQALAEPTAARTPGIGVDEALRLLRAVDDKSFLAYALNAAALLAWQAGDVAAAGDQARDALTASTIMRRQNDIAIARALLARLGDDESVQELRAFVQTAADRDTLSARARAAVVAAATAIDGISTPVSTVRAQA